jgi:hypothetical protein
MWLLLVSDELSCKTFNLGKLSGPRMGRLIGSLLTTVDLDNIAGLGTSSTATDLEISPVGNMCWDVLDWRDSNDMS